MTSEPWFQFAACKGMDPELWFPDRNGGAPEAKAVCQGCPVRDACLDYAHRELIHHGIWGGYTTQERQRMRRQLRRLGGAA